MPTDIERSDVDQGDSLPEGTSLGMVAKPCARSAIGDLDGPVALATGLVGQGGPSRHGAPPRYS